ncbi:MltR family transcriptional regulator [Rhizobium sp. SYY.PMSO]|uniref:MltR family transcriptional regulator n=1 Tax=Rhizobium sp. SYY.PMSO TaxID=3382192 RepID=UPI00398FBCF3
MADEAQDLAEGDEVFGKLNRLLAVLNKEKDDERALVLSIAAFSEDCLGRLLLAFMRDVKAAKELVEGFNAPLGTFSARIKACHAMGLLSDIQFADFEHIRKIRNEFAHNWDGINFAKPAIASRLAQIAPSRLSATGDGSDRGKLASAFASNLIECEVLISNLKKDDGRLKPQAVRLSAGKPVPLRKRKSGVAAKRQSPSKEG